VSRTAIPSSDTELAAQHVFVRRLPYVVLGWLVFAAAEWLLSRIAMRSLGSPSNALFRLSTSVCWIGLTFVIWAWIDRLDRSRLSRGTTIAAHVVAILVADVIDTAWRSTVQVAMGWRVEQSFPATALYFLDLTAVAYVAVVVLKRVADAQDAIVRQEHRQLTLRTQLAHAQLGFLETQLQPHFLFNSLGAVLELAHDTPIIAARMLRHLAALLRFAVHGRGQTVTLAEELDALEPYLEIQRLRFADWLTISRHATPQALRVNVPRMTLQPLVENAIRHGLAGRTKRGHIAICASLDGRALCLEVSDNGVGLGSSSRDADAVGLGLGNLTNRLRTLYGDGASVVLRTGTSGGATTEVRLDADFAPPPIEETSDAADANAGAAAFLPNLVRRNVWSTITIGWFLWGMIWVQLNIIWMSVVSLKPPRWSWHVLMTYGLGVLVWVVITPLMLAVARRNSLTRGGHWWRLALHVAFACAFALAHVAAWQLLIHSKEPLWSSGYIETTLWTAMLYVVLVGLTSYQEISEWLRERETGTARLRAEIAEADLTAASMRFDPEVVLARLEQAAAIVVIDAEAAGHSLTQLADHLRASLDTARGMPRTLVAIPVSAR
jgi:two-component system, LytTR family, sensor kinase